RRILEEVAQALAYAHARGVVHRDIQPANILLDRDSGRAMVTDFGIARTRHLGDTTLTQDGAVVGTPRYMAPEQLLGTAGLDGRADMYSVGLLGYFMIMAADAIQGQTLPEIIATHVRGTPVDLREVERRISAPLHRALARCLEPKVEDRYPQMESFVEALREVGEDLPGVTPSIQVFFREAER